MLLFSDGGGLELVRLVVVPFRIQLLKEKKGTSQHSDKITAVRTDLRRPTAGIKNTYKFLTDDAIFEEEHVWCDAIFVVVQGSRDARWVHGATRVKL